jgi:hypothetical protein
VPERRGDQVDERASVERVVRVDPGRSRFDDSCRRLRAPK